MAHISINFKSKALRMPVMLDVIMPQGHGSYKTLYLLHGAGGGHSSWLLKSRVADYVENSNIAVVMPSGNNKFYVDNKNGKDYLRFIAEELPQICEKWFSLNSKSEDRYIAGMSMGGYGALYVALKNPNFYNGVFAFSSFLNIKEQFGKNSGLDLFPVFGTEEDYINGDYDLFRLACVKEESSQGNVDNRTKFILSCGLQDNRINSDDSKKLSKHLKDSGFAADFISENGEHNWDYWDRCIRNVVELIKNSAVSGSENSGTDSSAGNIADWRQVWQSLM